MSMKEENFNLILCKSMVPINWFAILDIFAIWTKDHSPSLFVGPNGNSIQKYILTHREREKKMWKLISTQNTRHHVRFPLVLIFTFFFGCIVWFCRTTFDAYSKFNSINCVRTPFSILKYINIVFYIYSCRL